MSINVTDKPEVNVLNVGDEISTDQLAAIQSATNPSAVNPFATIADVGGGGGGNPFDQSLNTSDYVSFENVGTNQINIGGEVADTVFNYSNISFGDNGGTITGVTSITKSGSTSTTLTLQTVGQDGNDGFILNNTSDDLSVQFGTGGGANSPYVLLAGSITAYETSTQIGLGYAYFNGPYGTANISNGSGGDAGIHCSSDYTTFARYTSGGIQFADGSFQGTAAGAAGQAINLADYNYTYSPTSGGDYIYGEIILGGTVVDLTGLPNGSSVTIANSSTSTDAINVITDSTPAINYVGNGTFAGGVNAGEKLTAIKIAYGVVHLV